MTALSLTCDASQKCEYRNKNVNYSRIFGGKLGRKRIQPQLSHGGHREEKKTPACEWDKKARGKTREETVTIMKTIINLILNLNSTQPSVIPTLLPLLAQHP